MPSWARVKDGLCVEFTTRNPAGRFHPSIRWVPVPDHLQAYADGQYTVDDQDTVAPPSLDYLRRQLRPKVAEKRWRIETQTPIPVTLESGATINVTADDRTAAKVDQTLRLAEDYEATNGAGSWQVTWKTADGTFTAITLADLQTAWRRIGAHVAATFDREADINAKLDAAGTPEGIVQVITDELNTGWPDGGGA